MWKNSTLEKIASIVLKKICSEKLLCRIWLMKSIFKEGTKDLVKKSRADAKYGEIELAFHWNFTLEKQFWASLAKKKLNLFVRRDIFYWKKYIFFQKNSSFLSIWLDIKLRVAFSTVAFHEALSIFSPMSERVIEREREGEKQINLCFMILK